MLTLNLEQQLSGHVYAFMLVFTRIGAGMMFFPGISEGFVPSRIRLLFSLALTVLVYMPLSTVLPPMPPTIDGIVLLMFREMLAGVFYGVIIRMLINIVETTGAIIATQIGLSNAMILNPSLASQSALPSAFLSSASLAMIFVTGMDHMLLRGLIGTYTMFKPGTMLPPGDMVEIYSHLASRIFTVGVELAVPFLVIGILLFVVLGFMQRLITQVQLFIVMLPLQIGGGLFLFSVTIAVIITVWLQRVNDIFGEIFGR